MWALLLLVAGVVADEWAALRLWEAPAAFGVDSGALLGGAGREPAAAGPGQAGWRLRARLDVAPAWRDPRDPQHVLLRMRLEEPQLDVGGGGGAGGGVSWRAAGAGPWGGAGAGGAWLVRWERGQVRALYAPRADPPQLNDYRRAIASLFQFQLEAGERNETDASGSCLVRYEERARNVLRKRKRECEWRGHTSAAAPRAPLHSERVQRVTLQEGGGLEELVWDEEHYAARGGEGLRLRAWQRLAALPAGAGAGGEAPLRVDTLQHALAAAAARGEELQELALPLQADEPDREEEEESEADLERLPERLAGAAAAGGGGGAAAAAALLAALPALRRAPSARLAALLQRADRLDALAETAEALALAGGRGGHAAARAALRAAGGEPHAAAARYLLALPRAAPPPEDEVVSDVLRLAEHARDEDVRRAALLAAVRLASAAPPPAAARARALADAALRRCEPGDEPCRAAAARALCAAPDAEPDLLLRLAEAGGGAAPPALLALQTLAESRPALLLPAHMRRLQRLALAPVAPQSPDARAAALDALLTAAAAHAHAVGAALLPLPLPEVARALAAEPELLRFVWRRCAALAERYPAAARHAAETRRALRDPRLLAPPGGSGAMRRAAGRGPAGSAALLDSAQSAAHGALRGGAVRLLATGSDANAAPHELFALRVWARGLHSLAGDGGEGDEEEPAAGLETSAGGAWGGEATLFRGRGELLGALWSGAGSEPTPVARALLPLWAAADRVPLSCGAAARRDSGAATALALDAHAAVSLWSRTARAGAALRAGGAARARLRLAGGAGPRLAGAAQLEAEPRLALSADLDFYSAPTLCVRAAIPEYEWRRNVTLRRGAARLERRATWREAARSLALDRDNDAACRRLPPPDDD